MSRNLDNPFLSAVGKMGWNQAGKRRENQIISFILLCRYEGKISSIVNKSKQGGIIIMSKVIKKEEFDQRNVFGQGQPNTMFAQYFVGNSYLNPLTEFGKSPLFLTNVTFEPGCRNNWHIHHAKSGGGQILVCTAGEGWYQEEGKEAVSLVPGTVVTIPAKVKHWHGAKADSWFSHISIEVPGEETKNEWCEPVGEAYTKLK